jgi:hypothetical protein
VEKDSGRALARSVTDIRWQETWVGTALYREQGVLQSAPGYRALSILVVLGRAERVKFEERRYFWNPHLVKLYDEARTYHDGKWLTIPFWSADDRTDVTDLKK